MLESESIGINISNEKKEAWEKVQQNYQLVVSSQNEDGGEILKLKDINESALSLKDGEEALAVVQKSMVDKVKESMQDWWGEGEITESDVLNEMRPTRTRPSEWNVGTPNGELPLWLKIVISKEDKDATLTRRFIIGGKMPPKPLMADLIAQGYKLQTDNHLPRFEKDGVVLPYVTLPDAADVNNRIDIFQVRWEKASQDYIEKSKRSTVESKTVSVSKVDELIANLESMGAPVNRERIVRDSIRKNFHKMEIAGVQAMIPEDIYTKLESRRSFDESSLEPAIMPVIDEDGELIDIPLEIENIDGIKVPIYVPSDFNNISDRQKIIGIPNYMVSEKHIQKLGNKDPRKVSYFDLEIDIDSLSLNARNGVNTEVEIDLIRTLTKLEENWKKITNRN